MPDNLSFVHEIAELLEISYDSAYRRIRGEKELSLEELHRLSHKFEVSLDFLLGLQSNHVVLNDNTILVKIGDFRATYLTYNVISLLVTQDASFCSNVEQHMRQLMKKSNLISVSGDKERNRFFNKLLHTIEKTRTELEIS